LSFDIAVILAALGITTLELVETAAVTLALYGQTHKHGVFGYAALGVIAVFIPTFVIGKAITYLPVLGIRIVGGALLLYFGLRLVRSARRSVLRTRRGTLGSAEESLEKGVFYTAFSVGAIEAFEASIVLVGLLPQNYVSTIVGLAGGVVIVIISTYVLRSQVRKVKQANMKVFVSALLLSFSTFWFVEIVFPDLTDLILIPFFIVFALVVHWVANRPEGPAIAKVSPNKDAPHTGQV